MNKAHLPFEYAMAIMRWCLANCDTQSVINVSDDTYHTTINVGIILQCLGHTYPFTSIVNSSSNIKPKNFYKVKQ